MKLVRLDSRARTCFVQQGSCPQCDRPLCRDKVSSLRAIQAPHFCTCETCLTVLPCRRSWDFMHSALLSQLLRRTFIVCLLWLDSPTASVEVSAKRLSPAQLEIAACPLKFVCLSTKAHVPRRMYVVGVGHASEDFCLSDTGFDAQAHEGPQNRVWRTPLEFLSWQI